MMKKIISLILVVLLCLSTVSVGVSAAGADTYTITAVSGANTTSNDYLNIEKYLAYYDGGDTLSIPENYITVGQWKANIANPALNAGDLTNGDYITSDCTLTLTMDDGTTTKNVVIDAVDYNYLYREYDKKQTTTADDMKLLLGQGSNGTATTKVVNVSGDEYGLEYSWVTTGGTDATASRWYQAGTELKDIKKDIATPYVIEQTIVANAPGTSGVNLLFLLGGSRQAYISNNDVKAKILSGEPFTISAHIFPKTNRVDYYLDGVLIRENLSITDSKNNAATSYDDYGQWGIRFVNDSMVGGEYKDSSFVITDYQIRNGFGAFNADIYVEPVVSINYENGSSMMPEEATDIQATTNIDDYTTADLYINGTKLATETVVNKQASFDASFLKVGDNEIEVKMYKNAAKSTSSGIVKVTLIDSSKIFEIKTADGIDTASSEYLDIAKYLAYYDGGDTITLPKNYIKISQWNANIANPVVSGNGEYITSDCTLVWTAEDGVTTKNVVIDAVDYNYSLAAYDKKQTTTFESNNLGLSWSKGSKATVTAGNKLISGSEYALTLDTAVSSDATNTQGYVNIVQSITNANGKNQPYSVNMTIAPESFGSLYKVSVGFLNTTNNGRALKDLPESVVSAFKTSDKVNVSIVVYPKAEVYDVYVNGDIALANISTTDKSSGQTYANYNRVLLRFYDGIKIDNEYKNLTLALTDYEVRYGFGKATDPLYVEPEINISTYTDGAKVKIEDLVNIGAVTNSESYNTAELYVNGTKVATENITSKSVSFSSSLLKAGNNEIEVIMYQNGKKPVSSGKITVTVEGTVTIDGLTDGAVIHPDDFTGLIKATVNTDGYNTAEIYIDDDLVEGTSVSNKEAYFITDALALGRHTIEVRFYPTSGDYISQKITINISDLTASDIFEIVNAQGADTTSNTYLNIMKYFAYLEGEELNIPKNYITVGQWKANIANPAINSEGLSDDDYITSACTLTWTAGDGVTTKTVYINAVDYNYMYEKFDNTKTIDVTSSSKNNLKLDVSMGTNGTLARDNKDLGNGTYAISVDFNDFTGTTNPWNQLRQYNSSINKDVDTPYMVDMDLKFSNATSFNYADFGFLGASGTAFPGKQRAYTTLTGFKSLAQKGDTIRFTAVIYPKAERADIYVNGNLVKENHSLVYTDSTGTSSYADYDAFFLRFYNTTKVNNAYQQMTYEVSRYEIKYGFGSINAEIYVAPTIDITNYTDGASLTTESIVPVEVVTNSDEMKTAVLYIDGVKLDEVAVNNKIAVLDASSMGYGDHEIEVRMYPEIGEYISKTITVSVSDFVNLSDYTITFDEFKVGETPASISKPAEYFGTTNFLNYSNESLEDSSVIVNDAYVEYYDDVRGNVFHIKADPASNTDKTGRRIEIYQSNTANNMAVSFDIYFESFSGKSYNFLETRGTAVNTAVSMGADGLLTMSGTTTSDTKSIQLETGKWYTIEADFYCTIGGVVKLRVYDEDGIFVGSMESLNGAPYTDRVRIYTPYNMDNLQSGEAYVDNVKTTIISTTGAISEITAEEGNLNVVTAVLNGVSSVNDVKIVGSKGEVEILGYVFNIDDSKLTINTAQALDATDSYELVVYADGYAVPLSKGFEVSGGYIKVTDSYFTVVREKNYIALNVTNTTGADGKITVIISEWDGNTLISTRAETIVVSAGNNTYDVNVTEDVENVKIMPVKSLAKPILLSEKVIVK